MSSVFNSKPNSVLTSQPNSVFNSVSNSVLTSKPNSVLASQPNSVLTSQSTPVLTSQPNSVLASQSPPVSTSQTNTVSNNQEDIVKTYKFNADGTFNASGTLTIYDLQDNLRKTMSSFNTSYVNCKENVANCDNSVLNSNMVALNNAVVVYHTALSYIANIVIGSENQGLYGDIMRQRTNMDSALDILKNSQDPRNVQYKTKYDYTVYVSIIWAVLASRLLYYIFVEI
jgi:hypothetical protein